MEPLCLALRAMGTRFELVLAGPEPVALRAAGEEALEEIRRLERDLSRFRRGGLLTWVQEEAPARPLKVPGDFLALLLLCQEVHRESGGAFDPTVSPLLAREGFDTGPRAADPAGPVGFADVRLDPEAGTVHLLRAGLQLDFGAVGKGWALDRAGDLLREAGVGTGLLHGGTSTVLALGAPPGQDEWRVALRDPDSSPEEGRVLAVAGLCNRALSVSAPHGRMRPLEEGGAGHIMDPRNGAPARGVALAAVVARSAALADAWSTALVVSGRPEDAPGEALVLTEDGRLHHATEGGDAAIRPGPHADLEGNR